MTLETYITDLLYRYDCVIVPNFGAFVTNNKSAEIKANTFLPPYKQITFNSLIQNNDGLLANYIAQIDKTPYETALNYINFEVQEWVNKLLSEELDLKGLGYLYSDNEKILFEPENNTNYLTSSFGLGQFIVNDIRRNDLPLSDEDSIMVHQIENIREIYKEQVQTIEEKTPIFITPEKRRKTASFIKYAAIFVLSVSVLGMANKIHEDRLENQYIATINKNQKIREAKIQTATFVLDTPLPTITINTTVEKIEKYHIIAGAFRSESNANKKVRQLLEDGFKAKIVGKNKWNLIQVAFTSFSSIEKANIELTNIKNTIAKDAWLLVKE